MRDAYDSAAARSLTAWALVHNGRHAGNAVIAYARSGGVTATLSVWGGPFAASAKSTGHAGGSGYDKASAALSHAARTAKCQALAESVGTVDAAGLRECRRRFEGAGYLVASVLG